MKYISTLQQNLAHSGYPEGLRNWGLADSGLRDWGIDALGHYAWFKQGPDGACKPPMGFTARIRAAPWGLKQAGNQSGRAIATKKARPFRTRKGAGLLGKRPAPFPNPQVIVEQGDSDRKDGRCKDVSDCWPYGRYGTQDNAKRYRYDTIEVWPGKVVIVKSRRCPVGIFILSASSTCDIT